MRLYLAYTGNNIHRREQQCLKIHSVTLVFEHNLKRLKDGCQDYGIGSVAKNILQYSCTFLEGEGGSVLFFLRI